MGGYTTLYSGHIAIKGIRDQGEGCPGWGLPYERGGDTRRKSELDPEGDQSGRGPTFFDR